MAVKKPQGLELDEPDVWEVDFRGSEKDFFFCFPHLVLEDSILCLEEGSPDDNIREALKPLVVEPAVEIKPDGIAIPFFWVKPVQFHLPATMDNFNVIMSLLERHAMPELFMHLKLYKGERMYFHWHDAFGNVFWVSKLISEERIRAFCRPTRADFQAITRR